MKRDTTIRRLGSRKPGEFCRSLPMVNNDNVEGEREKPSFGEWKNGGESDVCI